MSTRTEKTNPAPAAPTEDATEDVSRVMADVRAISREIVDASRDEVEKVKEELEPERTRAEALLAEATACEREFGADIKALCGFNWEVLAGRVPSHHISRAWW